MLKMVALSVVFLFAKVASETAAKWANLRFLSDRTIRLRRLIMQSIFSRPFRLFRQKDDAYYLNLLGNDTEMYASERLSLIPVIVGGISDIIIYVVALYLINPWLMLACVVLSLLPLLTSGLFTKVTQNKREAFSKASEQYTGVLKEGIEGYEPIRVGCGTAAYMERFISACENKQKKYSSSAMANTICMQTLYTTAIFLNIGCTAVGGWLMLRGVLPLPMLFAAVSYSGNLSNSFTNITEYIITIRSTKKIVKKLHAECQTESQPTTIKFDGEKADVVYEKVSFAFDERQLYKGFSYHFQENGCYAVIGESGSGKSTLLKLLLKYYDDYAGSIQMAGHDIKTLSEDNIFEVIGVVDQAPFLFNASLYENIMLFRHDINENSDEYRKLLKDVNLTELAQRVGDKPLGDFGDNISGGERQRISLARTMRRHPRIVVFDEPTTGLDPENASLINQYIFNHKNMLRIVIGHNWENDYLKQFDGVIRVGE